ncbi:LysR family transcriptional regulator [Variovorax sp. J22R133]|uniref:LysR family transcriptional regulator n=1 Tax=Variovorax brevis TaxID=3053503 RepID=UPI002574C1DB|nr:LysR family transcriptional regulator [Variovorax sp. J22R133]MDM0111999.1 LysR family transcriptional regulator [Variovorax sp. J22R133]
MRYDLTSLEIFVAVAEAANLTRAAEQQHLAVSAISKRITELEELAGASLLQRHARGVSLTPAGQSMLHYARQVLQLMHRMRGELSEYAGGLKGVIRLHASTSALVEFLPRELQSFLVRYPMIRLQVEERTGAAIVRAVVEGAADIGILGDHTPLKGLASVPYHSDKLALGVPRGHALARRKTMHFAEALDFDFVGPHAESSLWSIMTQAAQSSGKTIEPRIQVSSFECMCMLVEAGLGIALLPEPVLAAHEELGRLSVVRLKDGWAHRQIVIVVRDLDSMPFTTRAMIEHLREPVPAN